MQVTAHLREVQKKRRFAVRKIFQDWIISNQKIERHLLVDTFYQVLNETRCENIHFSQNGGLSN